MNIGNKNDSGRKQSSNTYKKKSYSDKRENRNPIDSKTCTRCGRLFGEMARHGQKM